MARACGPPSVSVGIGCWGTRVLHCRIPCVHIWGRAREDPVHSPFLNFSCPCSLLSLVPVLAALGLGADLGLVQRDSVPKPHLFSLTVLVLASWRTKGAALGCSCQLRTGACTGCGADRFRKEPGLGWKPSRHQESEAGQGNEKTWTGMRDMSWVRAPGWHGRPRREVVGSCSPVTHGKCDPDTGVSSRMA